MIASRIARRYRLAALLLLLLTAALPGTQAQALRAATASPVQNGRYHTNDEAAALLQQLARDHPSIMALVSIGRSYEGRTISAVLISDNVHINEDEPEALIISLQHGNELIAREVALDLTSWLVTAYGADPVVTWLVNEREIIIVPSVNPDGAAFSQSYPWDFWARKNRQPIAGSDAVGFDLNRTYGYRWGCCGGSSVDPESPYYRGRAPFEAVEAAAVRDLVVGRRVGGAQPIRVALDIHSEGGFVMWPYGSTMDDQPPDMQPADLRAFQAVGRELASLNGYVPQQASDYYIHDGSFLDWAYGEQGIFAFTIEVVPWDSEAPAISLIEQEAMRNRAAVAHLLLLAACPYRASGEEVAMCPGAAPSTHLYTPLLFGSGA